MKTENLVPTNIEGYAKNMATGVLINNNDGEYQRILSLREKKRQDRAIVRDIDRLKEDMLDIKNMLALLIKGKHN